MTEETAKGSFYGLSKLPPVSQAVRGGPAGRGDGFLRLPRHSAGGQAMLHKWEEPVFAGPGRHGHVLEAALCGAATAKMPP